ncbi:hypothetical protein SAMN05444422_11562 [Halobiforma haloterrestris]|uniref:Uncharacterized protein n=1 Tax=Natronobacterium haloterrestre TaxID=148448 RepID=A0A1I1LAM9_NATHA|nr:hypothetical protein [Halobiforma haloterrestris]SFC70187.1 hypothetical protein SAMN05444422_11562 [Halobiforma haloterrestris]
MFRRARELGPPVLVPLAWLFVTAAHLEIVTEHTLFIAHIVMTVLLIGFAATGYPDMRDGVLRTWWRIIAAGSAVTLCGVVGLGLEPANPALAAVTLYGWMLLPAVGFVDTGRRVNEGTWIYAAGTAGCLLGAVLYAVGSQGTAVGGLVLVGLGQTAGIFDAALRY